MALFNNKDENKNHSSKGILGAFSVDVIKWEPETDQEASIIVHKFGAEDFPSGSQLIVHPSQMAVFINNLSAGNSLDNIPDEGKTQVAVFVGPCRIKLETGDSRFAPFRRVSHALTGGESAYHSSVYFINTTYMNELSWGTHSPILVTDPEEHVNVHVRAFGLFGAHIEQTDTSIAVIQANKFLRKIVGTRSDYSRDELVDFMRSKILEYVPDMLAKNIVEKQISVLKISTYLTDFSVEMKEKLKDHFDEFGLTLDNFSFHNINVPEEDLSAINELKIEKKRMQLEAEGTAMKMDIESEARARMRAREGYTYQQEQSFNVLQSAAQNEGTPSGFMGAGMGLGMGIGMGGAFGTGMTEVAQNVMSTGQENRAQGEHSILSGNSVCPKCGTKLNTGAKFCLNCGTKIDQGIICPDCGTALPIGAKFCFNCGRHLASVCPQCGSELPDGARFCMNCGAKI